MRKFFVRLLTVCVAICLTACGTTATPMPIEWDDTPVYTVEYFDYTAPYEKADAMWVATTDMDEATRKLVSRWGAISSFGDAIMIFLIHSYYPVSCRPYWHPVLNRDGVSNVYHFSEKGTRSYSTEKADILNALAPLTSEEQPLYMTRYQDRQYAVIGDTAYYWYDDPEVTENIPESLPAINTDGIDVKVVRLW